MCVFVCVCVWRNAHCCEGVESLGQGLQHALWLCIVTMTTVGYGDSAEMVQVLCGVSCPGSGLTEGSVLLKDQVPVNVCMCVCMCIYIYTCVYIYICIEMLIYLCVWTHVSTRICICTHWYVGKRARGGVCVCVCACMHDDFFVICVAGCDCLHHANHAGDYVPKTAGGYVVVHLILLLTPHRFECLQNVLVVLGLVSQAAQSLTLEIVQGPCL